MSRAANAPDWTCRTCLGCSKKHTARNWTTTSCCSADRPIQPTWLFISSHCFEGELNRDYCICYSSQQPLGQVTPLRMLRVCRVHLEASASPGCVVRATRLHRGRQTPQQE